MFLLLLCLSDFFFKVTIRRERKDGRGRDYGIMNICGLGWTVARNRDWYIKDHWGGIHHTGDCYNWVIIIKKNYFISLFLLLK